MDWPTVIFGTIGGFIVSMLAVYIAFRKLPLELRGTETKLSRDAYELAQQAVKDRLEDSKRFDTMETTIDELEANIKGLKKINDANEQLIKIKDKRIDELEKKVKMFEGMLASQRAEFEVRLAAQKEEYEREILGYRAVVDDLDKQLTTLKREVGTVKKTTDELKEKK